MMIRKILRHSTLGLPIEDKYHIGYKRYDASGTLYADSFSKLLKQFLKSIRNKLQKYPNVLTDEDIKQVILSTSSTITNKLRFDIATEEWVYQQGVSQVMEPHTAQWSHISHVRKFFLQVGKDSKNQGPRQIHPSSMPFIFPLETPEGAQHLGIVNDLSIGTTVTSGIFNISMIVDLIWDYLEPLSTLIDKTYCNKVMVVINGRPVGLTKMANNICNLLEDFVCACIFQDVYLTIRSGSGRLTIPLVDIKNIDVTCTSLNSAMLSVFIKYVDPLELKTYEYSLHPDGSKRYSLIHAITPLGSQAAVIPYLNHTALFLFYLFCFYFLFI